MRTFTLSSLFLVMICASLQAQKLPTTNVYLFNMEQVTDSTYSFEKPKYLTAFNPEGYNNQPSFISNDEIYLTVQMANDTTQTDIFSLNLKTMTKTRVTATKDSEYSPTVKPSLSKDGLNEFTCVRVEADGKSTQRIWSFPVDRSTDGQPIFENTENIGYHVWLTNKKAALFIVGAPHQLALAHLSNENIDNITANIGRCLQRLPNGHLAYVHKLTDNSWLLKKLNTGSRRSELITATLKGKEDFVVLPNGTFLMGSGSKLYKLNPKKEHSWIEIGDFKSFGINDITRLAVKGNKIAIVSKER